MKYLSQFQEFDFAAFAKGKVFVVTGCNQWKDYETKKVMGTKVDCVIAVDKTEYLRKEGDTSSNRFEKISFKVARDNLNIPNDSQVMPVDAEATVWGDYRNQLSVKCSDVQVAQRKE